MRAPQACSSPCKLYADIPAQISTLISTHIPSYIPNCDDDSYLGSSPHAHRLPRNFPLIDAKLLQILRCPQDHSSLTPAEQDVVERINRGIADKKVTTVGGQLLEKPFDGGLVREAGDLLYAIVDGIPVMLPDEAIELSQIGKDW
jgi:uncharacterized protein YbaR (Trm112 family)